MMNCNARTMLLQPDYVKQWKKECEKIRLCVVENAFIDGATVTYSF